MLKKSITYKDFNGISQTETFAFHLSPPKLMELEATWPGGLEKHMKRIMDSKDGAQILELFQRLIQLSIGQISDDGKRFIQNDEVRDNFIQTNAYTVLFLELGSNEQTAADFFNGIVPQDLAAQLEKLNTDDAPQAVRQVAEGTPVNSSGPGRGIEKYITQAQAEAMTAEELAAKVRDGYLIKPPGLEARQ